VDHAAPKPKLGRRTPIVQRESGHLRAWTHAHDHKREALENVEREDVESENKVEKSTEGRKRK
jgi:hypothetical protein